MIVTLDSKRRLTIPAALAPAVPADYFDAQFAPKEDTPVFRRIATNSDWLCFEGCGTALMQEYKLVLFPPIVPDL